MPGTLHDRATAFVERLEALRPRARGLLPRARRLADPAAWEIDGAGRPVRYRARHWARAAADQGAIVAELVDRDDARALKREACALFAALQEREERRLAERVRSLPEATSDREHAEDLLLDLAQGRLNAKREESGRAAAWGQIVRRQWLQPRSRLLRIVEG